MHVKIDFLFDSYAENGMSLSQTKHVTSVRRTIEVSKDGGVETILEVSTDLVIRI